MQGPKSVFACSQSGGVACADFQEYKQGVRREHLMCKTPGCSSSYGMHCSLCCSWSLCARIKLFFFPPRHGRVSRSTP